MAFDSTKWQQLRREALGTSGTIKRPKTFGVMPEGAVISGGTPKLSPSKETPAGTLDRLKSQNATIAPYKPTIAQRIDRQVGKLLEPIPLFRDPDTPNILKRPNLGREVAQGMGRNLFLAADILGGGDGTVEPKSEFARRLTGVQTGDSFNVKDEGRDILSIVGQEDAPTPVLYTVGLLSVGADVWDALTVPGKKKAVLSVADTLFDAVRKGDGSFDTVARQVAVDQLKLAPGDADTFVRSAREMAEGASSKGEFAQTLSRTIDTADITKRAREADNVSDFQKALTSDQRKTIARDLKTSDADFFNTVKRGATADTPTPRTATPTARQADTVADVSPDLLTAARRFKSAEEFIEAQPKFFHGTYSKDVATKIDREGLAFQKGGTNRGDKISLTKSEDIALTYSGKEGGIVEVFPAKNARIATAKDLPEVKFTTFEDGKKLFNASEAIDAARKKGFDGVDISSFDKKSIGNDVLNEELVILNPSKFQTKSQLTDIWNRANAAPETPTAKTPATETTRKAQPEPSPSISDSISEAKWESNPAKAQKETHKAVVEKYSGVDVDNAKMSTAHKDISNLPPVTNIPKKARKFGETNERIDFPEETWMQARISDIQDSAHRLGFLQRRLEGQYGVKLTDEMNAYLQQEALVGVASAKIGKVHKSLGLDAASKNGLFRRMRKDDILIDDLADYMSAKNAPARNARVNKLTKGKIPDGGSGMTNAQAAKILKKYEGNPNIEKYAQEYRKLVIDARLKTLEDSGLYTKKQIDMITAGEPDYVPAKVAGKRAEQGGTSGGKMGSSFQRLKGSARTDRTNAVLQALADLETTITRAETNKMRQSLKKLVEEFPDDTLWEVRRVKHMPQYNKYGEVEFLKPMRKASEADNTIEVFENGKAFDIVIHDDALAKVFTKNGQRKPIEALVRVNNYLRGVNTVMNPEFIMTNAIRDVQTALVIAGGEKGAKVATGMVRDYPKASKGIWDAVRKNSNDGWAGIYNEMVDAGGRTGWFDLMEVEERTRKTARLIEKYNGTKTSDSLARAFDGVGQVISDANEVAEMSVRVSAYKQLRDGGMTKAQAANYVKNMTVNFNKHGNVGLLINSMYLFANAGIQGGARLITSLRYPKVRRMVYGITASSYAINELNMMINPEGYSRVQDFEKERKLIIMLPKDGNKYNIPGVQGDPRNGYYLSVPLPYGFNIFKVAGDVAFDTVNKKKTPAESMNTMLGAIDAAFNPLSSGTANQFISPTFLDPFVSAFENKNWFGAPIKPEQPAFAPPVKESSRYFSGARDISVNVAQKLNRLTGGNAVSSGFVDMSPEIIDHVIDTLGGGLGNFVAQTVDGTQRTIRGDIPTFDEMPFVRKLIDRPYEKGEQSAVFELLDRSATQKMTQIEIDRFADSAATALETGQIDIATAKRVMDTFITNNTRQYAGEIKSLMDEGNIDKALEVLESAPAGITKELNKLIKSELEKEIQRLQSQQK